MDSRTVFLSSAVFVVTGLVGCQTVKTDSMLTSSDIGLDVKPITWEKSGDIFHVAANDNLAASESRVVFFRAFNDSDPSHNINIGVGADNLYQTSLQSGYYSDAVICSGSQIINVGKLHKKSGKVVYHSENYRFIPQTTTYLQVALSEMGNPVIQQIPADQALKLLNQSRRQTHQISRVSSNCLSLTSDLTPQSISASTIEKPIETQKLSQFKVLFDFDSADVGNKHSAVLDGMASFIQSYPKVAVILEGHTDNRGSENYNLKLSQSRADVVKNILVDQYGIEAIRLSTLGYGETMAIDTNNTEQGRQNNRRVVAVVSKENN